MIQYYIYILTKEKYTTLKNYSIVHFCFPAAFCFAIDLMNFYVVDYVLKYFRY